MANTKIGNISWKSGEYTGKDGKTHGNWERVGALFQNEKGGFFVTIKATFNPAGIPRDDGRDSVILSVFPDQKDGQSNGGYQGGNNGGYHDGFYGPNTYSPPPDTNFGKSYDPYAPGDPNDVPF